MGKAKHHGGNQKRGSQPIITGYPPPEQQTFQINDI